ncbi:MAG: class I SAM-dependent methyltransferase [Betaproteobacteria bacterium]|nr:class I SAM-dependent methyltransferase [Betaproteobacteria bacterium]
MHLNTIVNLDTRAHPASFRDAAGTVFESAGRVFRRLAADGVQRFDAYRACGFQEVAERGGRIVRTQAVETACHGRTGHVLEHEKVRFISYPYEWPFSLLKAAALFHLELNMDAIRHGLKMVDASAFNVQFDGVRPVFIDVLSFDRYIADEPWVAHTQFCTQFLNPLLLAARRGIPFHPWYRGDLEGIGVQEVSRLLGPWSWLSLNTLLNVHLPARATRSARLTSSETVSKLRQARVPRSAVIALMKRLAAWIAKLELPASRTPGWHDYRARRAAFAHDDAVRESLVREAVGELRPSVVLDVGCNDGHYGALAHAAGAEFVVGVDLDDLALEQCVARARKDQLPLLPLRIDWCNPTPNQGWRGKERSAFLARCQPDFLIAFAVLHHVSVGRNVPLADAVAGFVEAAPRGVVEFVPPGDPLLARLLSFKSARLVDYSEQAFFRALGAKSRIVRRATLPDSGRVLAVYERR